MGDNHPQQPPRDEMRRLHAELAGRLRHVCADMPPESFDALVREVARVKVKYDLPATHRL